ATRSSSATTATTSSRSARSRRTSRRPPGEHESLTPCTPAGHKFASPAALESPPVTALGGRGLRLPAAGVAAGRALRWPAAAPPTPDLGAALYRGGLFSREGMALYDSAWYGGHHLLGYSILSPAFGALVGVRTSGAIGAVLAAVLFERLATAHWGRAARPAVLLYALATATDLAIGRVAFGLGVAVGLAALLALQRRRA